LGEKRSSNASIEEAAGGGNRRPPLHLELCTTAEFSSEVLRDLPNDAPSSLVFIHPSGPLMGKRIPLESAEYVIGRSAAADIHSERNRVSRRHARLYHRGTSWIIEDLNSTNGIVVNGTRVKKHTLQDGETVRIGDTVLRFLSGDNVEAAYHEEIYRLTIVDALTGTVNKRYFLEFLERESALSERYGQPLSLVMFDLDDFKQINDVYGHQIGDLVLRVVTARIRPRIRREDLFARYGGDEFAVILTHTDRAGALELAEAIRDLIRDKPIMTNGHRFMLTLSIGIATVGGADAADSRALIEAADKNLYRAKAAGKNQVVG